MSYDVASTKILLEQIGKLPSKHKKQIENKIDLIKQNPFRFKAIHSKLFSRVFRVRLNIDGKETRLIYVLLGSKIILVCLLDRSGDYKDLESYLAKVEM